MAKKAVKKKKQKINSKTKGKVGELELSHALKDLFGFESRRGQQYNGLEGEDVVGIPGVHIECKRVENLSLYPAMEQSIRDSVEGQIPCVMHRRNHKQWLCTVQLEDLGKFAATFLRELQANNERSANLGSESGTDGIERAEDESGNIGGDRSVTTESDGT